MDRNYLIWVLSGFAVTVVYISSAADEGAYEVRLQGGDRNGTTGRVEVRRNASEEWGSVCDDLWTEREAQVVCIQLGFKWGTAHSNSPFGEGSGPIYLDNVQCTGQEKYLSECQSNGWGVHNCKHYEDAGVSCYNHSVRLKSRGVTNVGTVEIRTSEGWVQVCDEEWTDEDATVVCKEQDYTYGKSLRKSKLGKMSTSDSVSTLSFYQFSCEGREEKLKDCSHRNKSRRCDTLERASAICLKEPPDNTFAIRFVQPNGDQVPNGTMWGEISVRKYGVWGQVCGSGTDWNDRSARVACRQMGFAGGRAYGTVNETLRPIWITKLNCSGNERSLEDCVQDVDSWGHPVHSCRPAYALCYKQNLQVSLAGNGSYFGRVQITYDNVTGTVCDDAWSSSDARVLCKSLGFKDGEPIQNSYYGPGTGPIMMNGLSCYGYENSLFQCRNNGWMVYNNTKCSNHAHDASVICYKEVRLSRGDHSHGVVQIMDQYWSVLCGEGFDEKDAQVICKHLGFQHGRSLPKGTFGTFYGRYSRPNIACRGNETSILDCPYDRMRGCQRENYLGYAAVSCYNGSLNSNLELKLTGPMGSTNQTGRVSIKKYGIWGRICPSAWDDKDADVVCRQLKYTGGVAYQDTSTGSGPYFLGEVNCHGNESVLFNCSIGVEECDSQYSSGTAGVLCYKHRKPKLQLVGGTYNSGRLEIIMDNEVGSICDVGWSRYDATVACKQMNFTDGEFKRGLPGPNIPKFLSGMNCFGGESSIFMCRNRGWKQSIPEECNQPNRNAGVFCYNNVRISSGQSEDNATTGQVEMYLDGSWVTVCAEGFDEADAKVVCRELGFPNSKKLVPGAFGSKYFTNSILNLNCTGNENSIKDCPYTEGTCPRRSYNYASIICSKHSVDTSDVRLLPPNEFPDTLLVEKYGINGTICAEDWNEKSATVACKQLHYDGGVPFGPRYYSSRTPIWMSSVNCSGLERSINHCQRRETPISESCLSSRLAARVFCYRGQGFNLRLNGTDRNDYSGRVEISYNGVWGTICDSYWSNNDARVVCRQLGFVDGVAEPRGKYGKGSGPSWLYYVRCDGNEKAIWECSNSGWNVTHTSCRAHDYDAGVYCTGKVRLEPNITFGAVEIWQDTQYALVCADEFDDVDAQVVCHSLGFQNGISICCSVFDDSIMLKYPISVTNVQCTGHETSILQCNYRTNTDACQSRKYASVACSNSASSGAYELRLSEEYKGVVQVRHLNIWGTICPNGFDNKDAKVICRELGYQDGFSYYEHEFTVGDRQSLPWLSNLNCTGAEGYLARCGNIRWGDVRNCSTDTKAAVYCLDNAKIPIRLTNGTSLKDGNRIFTNTSGRVEVSINNQWGTICGTSYWDDEDATVLCRMLNHTSGRALRYGQFGAGTGPIWIAYLRCQGDEDSIFHCPMAFNEQQSSSGAFLPSNSKHGCSSHNSDAAVQCYDSVRLVDSKDVFYGRLEMYVNKTFTSVCDEGFTDNSAKVVCNILGYPHGHKQCCSALGDFPSENITVTNVQCRGTERSLDQCRHESTAVRPCRSGKYVSVYCSAKQVVENDKQEIEVRIREDKYYGSLEANKYGFWSPICNKGWDDHDANVTCRQLGYFGGVAFKGSSRLQSPISVGRFNCTGLEGSLKECGSGKFGEDLGCSQKIVGRFTRTTAGVLCYQDNGGLKFRINGGRKRGRVEVFYHGMWGRVCNRQWDDKDARVFCRSLGKGFIDGEAGQEEAEEDKSSVVWVDYVNCEGTEDGLLQCDLHWDPDYSSCTSATVICMDSVRLEKGDKKSHGVVQVYQHDNWGTVCNHQWSKADISVTCRQLGYERGVSICCGAYGYLYAKGVIDKVNCKGNETSLLNCTTSPPTGACSQDYAAVACFNGTLPSYRDYQVKVAGSSNTSGALELTFLNISGRICADGWDDADATVACRQMGYMKGLAYNHKILFGKGSPIWATNVNCTGNEYMLSQCPNFTLGSVKDCRQRFDAGVVCYSTVGVNFRLTGPTSYYGRVDMSVDGVWGTICNRYWDNAEASAFCRSIGFNTGFPYHKKSDLKSTDDNFTIYEPNIHCKGKENTLLDCPHEGWKEAFSSACQSHEKDATVHCYNTVKLDTGIGMETKDGPVMYYYNNTWNLICDKDFDDMTARVVCRELGFVDGRSVCCSAYGKTFDHILVGKSLRCNGNENSITECLKPSDCGPYDMYSSVICFNKSDMGQVDLMSGGYKVDFVKDDNQELPPGLKRSKGQIAVQQYGIVGRISSQFWDDMDAQVFCRSQGAKYGIAYQMAPKPFKSDPTYLMSHFNCTGSERSLLNCSFHGRKNLGNNTIVNTAAALCYNESGINYTIVGDKPNAGRVELSFNNRWGTVCDLSWDNQDAGVFCRMMNFSDGYAIPGGKFGEGTGPIWLSHLVCKGDEKSIHSCAHHGFSEENVTTGWKKCSSHKDDAGVHCVDKLRLNLGYDASMGAVELFYRRKWTAVCETASNNLGARVVCRTLGYSDGRAVPGSAFGNITSSILVRRIDCSGNEDDLFKCNIDYTTPGVCSKYLSVYCSHTNIIQKQFDVKLDQDDDSSDTHGEVMVKLHGIWGSVCMKGWTDQEASITCQQLGKGFIGGVPYLIPNNKKYKHPMLMSYVKCNGSETSLEQCKYLRRDEAGSCKYEDKRAGVLCYKTSGIKYQFYPNSTYNRGRVEIQYEGTWGGVCDFLWDSRDAEVFCRSQGFKGGIEIAGGQFGQSTGPLWFTRVSCEGNEPDILQCNHSGFNNSGNVASTYERLCKKRSNDAAAWCFTEEVQIKSVRLADGGENYGRVEVYLSGPNEWGTICDDYWDDRDATVICRQLGFATGTAKKQGSFGRGSGPIWLDNMDCSGEESRIQDCKHNGFNIQNCHHGEDSGVICHGDLKTDAIIKKLEEDENLAVAITVPIIVILVVVIVVIAVVYWRQRDSGDSLKTTLVDNEIHDPSASQSASTGEFNLSETGGRVTLSRLKATFSKAIGTQNDSKPRGLGNSNYENMRNEGADGVRIGPGIGDSEM